MKTSTAKIELQEHIAVAEFIGNDGNTAGRRMAASSSRSSTTRLSLTTRQGASQQVVASLVAAMAKDRRERYGDTVRIVRDARQRTGF